jgi:hypothetical protein
VAVKNQSRIYTPLSEIHDKVMVTGEDPYGGPLYTDIHFIHGGQSEIRSNLWENDWYCKMDGQLSVNNKMRQVNEQLRGSGFYQIKCQTDVHLYTSSSSEKCIPGSTNRVQESKLRKVIIKSHRALTAWYPSLVQKSWRHGSNCNYGLTLRHRWVLMKFREKHEGVRGAMVHALGTLHGLKQLPDDEYFTKLNCLARGPCKVHARLKADSRSWS